jgi:hypothetical protein
MLHLVNVTRASSGAYSVAITNAGGWIISSNAVLSVRVQQVLGSPTVSAGGVFSLVSRDKDGGAIPPSALGRFTGWYSTNLVHWMVLPNSLSVNNGTLVLTDTNSPGKPMRFYRITEQ